MEAIFPERIETDRLELTRLTSQTIEVEEFYRICSTDPGIEEVTKYVTWDPHESIKETIEFVERCERKWEEHDSANYVIRPLADEDGAGEIAGTTALNCDWDRRTGVLGVWFRKRFWGRGYSAERASALMELAFETLDLELVSVSHHVENDNSQRAIEKYIEDHGGRREGLLRNWIAVDGEVFDVYRFTVSQEEYRESR